MKTLLVLLYLLLICNIYPLCAEVWSIGGGYYAAGVRTDEFQFRAAPEGHGRQWQDQWCWAASIQMVLNFHGIPVAQHEIVKKGIGRIINQGGDSNAILRALDNWAFDLSGRPCRISADTRDITNQSIVSALANKWPLIVGLTLSQTKHAVVLTAVEFYYDQDGRIVPINAIIAILGHTILVNKRFLGIHSKINAHLPLMYTCRDSSA